MCLGVDFSAGVLDEGMNDDGGRKEGRKEERMDLLFVPFLSSAPQAQVDQTWF
jgi:hypothetical protein